MKIAVTSSGNSLESEIDQRFGRAKSFIVVDSQTNQMEIHDNTVNLNAAQGAGIQSAQNLANMGVEAIITGHLGPNAFRTLSAAGIRAYTKLNGTVGEAIEELKAGKLKAADSADVEGHW